MEHNVYAPPMAVVADAPAAAKAGGDFHVVGKAKFLTLTLLTFGWYQLVWFYQHWATFKARRKVPMWPVARAIFPIFFTHALTEEIDHNLKRADIVHRWSPVALATVAVVLSIIIRVLDRLPGELIPDDIALKFSLVCLLPLTYALWKIQQAANLACGEPEGESNRRFTAANWVWMVLFGLLWMLIIIGLTVLPEA